MARNEVERKRECKGRGSSPVCTDATGRTGINKLHHLIINFLCKCVEGGAFRNKRPIPYYFALKKYLPSKLKENEIEVLYDYSLIAGREQIPFYQFANNAFAWNEKNNREQSLSQRKAVQYKEYSIKDFIEFM